MTQILLPAVGIDLGTTYSVVARLDERGQPVTLVNSEGDRLTPSVVLMEGDNAIVGKEAMKAMSTEADRVAECAKRDMGHRAYHRTAWTASSIRPRSSRPGSSTSSAATPRSRSGRSRRSVITVPAYFDEVRRKATQDAGYMAGCEVMDIINEPTAAAVAFGFQQGFLNAAGSTDRPRRVLVYDLGGGTFDVTVMEIRGSEFLALATDGDVALGGYDWDQRLLNIAADAFQQAHGSTSARMPPRRASSGGSAKTPSGRSPPGPRRRSWPSTKAARIRVEVSREQFEEVTQDLLDRTRFTCVQALRAAGLDWSDLDRVLLVGGSTRMPMVRAMLQQHQRQAARRLGRRPTKQWPTARPCMPGCSWPSATAAPANFSIRNVNSHSLGVVGIDPETKRRRNGMVIPRNTPLPVSAVRQFKTSKQDQRSILVQIVEGETPSADDCTAIGRCTVADLPPGLPAKSPVDVIFHYKADGRLKVRVHVPHSERQVETEIVRENGLSKEHMDAWRKFISGDGPTEYR